ncbi:phosphatase PAP2 family protein [Chromatocurvus halotolerans]|uniref:undecaprenyl-diphosphate phosphatase n=1 Tax=Chromatocurvus halotolerans TaxID=1132028 RepID=A0A4V2SBG8_9GAMM|nr:undecaprenyl-diphosphatase [Chromatocurvus halotolerans]
MRALNGIASIDRQWLLATRGSTLWILRHSRVLSRSADGYLYIALPLLLAAVTTPGVLLLQHAAITFSLERVVYWVLKNSFRRRRPAELLPGFHSRIIAADQFSMPSGHTSGAFLFVTLLVVHYGATAALFYLWSAAVGMSRVSLGVHFPSDTVLGAALGTSLCLFTAGYLL